MKVIRLVFDANDQARFCGYTITIVRGWSLMSVLKYTGTVDEYVGGVQEFIEHFRVEHEDRMQVVRALEEFIAERIAEVLEK